MSAGFFFCTYNELCCSINKKRYSKKGGTEMERRRGRPKTKNPLVFRTVGLTEDQWQWLNLWLPGASPTAQLQELFGRSVKFWPGGPAVFRHQKPAEGDVIDSSGWLQSRLPAPAGSAAGSPLGVPSDPVKESGGAMRRR